MADNTLFDFSAHVEYLKQQMQAVNGRGSDLLCIVSAKTKIPEYRLRAIALGEQEITEAEVLKLNAVARIPCDD
jgi:hypothetical protein